VGDVVRDGVRMGARSGWMTCAKTEPSESVLHAMRRGGREHLA
jgi:hypothetical protein